MSPTYLKLIEKYPKAIIVGLTATPVRADGTGLGAIYTDMVQAPSIKALTKAGNLCKAIYYAPSVPDLRKIGTIAGDYNQGQLTDVMDQPKLIGNVVETWKHLARGKSTIVFASGVKHSQHLAETFNAQGIPAGHIDGGTNNDERIRILGDFNSGRITVLCNCMVLTEGFDAPLASVCVLARPTKSLSLYIQMVGRVLRPYEGKEHAIIIDHSGAVHTNGFATDDQEWKLGHGRLKENHRKERGEREEKTTICEGCFRVFTGSNICPSCGQVSKQKSAYTDYIDGQLGLVSKKTKKVERKEQYGEGFKESFYAELLGHCLIKHKKPGWAAHKYRERFKEWPSGNPKPKEPTVETLSYIRHLNIKYARSRKYRRK